MNSRAEILVAAAILLAFAYAGWTLGGHMYASDVETFTHHTWSASR